MPLSAGYKASQPSPLQIEDVPALVAFAFAFIATIAGFTHGSFLTRSNGSAIFTVFGFIMAIATVVLFVTLTMAMLSNYVKDSPFGKFAVKRGMWILAAYMLMLVVWVVVALATPGSDMGPVLPMVVLGMGIFFWWNIRGILKRMQCTVMSN